MWFFVVAVVALPAHAYPKDVGSVVKTIQESLRRDESELTRPQKVCFGEECPFSSMEAISRVYPGGETSCIFGSPFAFDVYKGSPSKVFVYFEGGGACWDYPTTFVDPLCTTDVEDAPKVGIFDQTHPKNPFKDVTIVNIRYCSGDCHIGENTQHGILRTATQRGVKNAQATIDWIQRQQRFGELAPELELLIIGGASAGSIGAQVWAKNVTDYIAAKNTALIFDSYVGVLNFETQLFQSLGVCPFLPTPYFQNLCWTGGNVSLANITAYQLAILPHAAAASILSKEDNVQISYFDALQIFRPLGAIGKHEASELSDTLFISPATFYADAQRILQVYTDSAFRRSFHRPAGDPATYIVDSDQHTYLPGDVFYDTKVFDGPTLPLLGDPDTDRFIPLTDWLADLLSFKKACETCYGPRTLLPALGDADGTDYCDLVLDPRCAALPAFVPSSEDMPSDEED